MIDRPSLDQLGRRIDEAVRDSPVQDIARNLRVLVASWLDRLDFVPREDFEVQKQLLENARAKLAQLEARVAELETRAAAKGAR